MLATLVEEPFDRKDWIFETKWDGYRAFGSKRGRKVELISRNQKRFNERFPHIVEALRDLPGSFVLDGEIVILDKKGKSEFQLLQNNQGTPLFYVFDLLVLNGKDLRGLPLLERKRRLKELVKGSKLIRYSDHIKEKGRAFFQKAQKKGWEGIIAKNGLAPYQPFRTMDWQKIKTKMRQEMVIGGFTEPRGSRKKFGALLVGVYDRGKLLYSGHVGGGFNQKLLADTYAHLKKLITKKCPFAVEPKPNMPVTWVKPKLVCEVAFAEWTREGMLRQPIFKGLRIDKRAKEVVRETV